MAAWPSLCRFWFVAVAVAVAVVLATNQGLVTVRHGNENHGQTCQIVETARVADFVVLQAMWIKCGDIAPILYLAGSASTKSE
ncbi:hypothetical protein BKA67DRAFT_569980 [Truncatella angustata]|uniref:Secreted protein n=1 Tax=Truncatella angustata TaxID=152316 RepID=A0A9P8ZX15_9PEZI|nr:uncharacterized protein BKA67DRAFT_569980 [Truncatella angustata]KAH6653507.1 hypothetical protein BKA67DRAFT_569980 [Truncatella angustata]